MLSAKINRNIYTVNTENLSHECVQLHLCALYFLIIRWLLDIALVIGALTITLKYDEKPRLRRKRHDLQEVVNIFSLIIEFLLYYCTYSDKTL